MNRMVIDIVPLTGHMLLVSCPKPDQEELYEKLDKLRYEKEEELEECIPIDSAIPVARSRWFRYDTPQDSWWLGSTYVADKLHEWIRLELAKEEADGVSI